MSGVVCCVCLTGDLKLSGIANEQLLNIFEKLTNFKVWGAMCVACEWQLRQCGRFARTARRSHCLLSDISRRGLQVTQETLSELKIQPIEVLSISDKRCMYTVDIVHPEEESNIKDEVSIKVEEVTEDIGFTDIIDSDNDSLNKDDIEKINRTPVAKSIEHNEPVKMVEDKPRKRKKNPKNTRKVRKKLQQYTCEFCKKNFNRKNEMIVHRRTHTGERPFPCDKCPKAFISASNLKYHQISHVPISARPRLYSCHDCGNTFSHKMHLRLHLQIHQEKKYTCNLCSKSFVMPTRLKNHMQTHSSERTHSCDRCAKSFKTLGVLRDHMLTHTGEKPHSCNECDKTFTRRHELSLHKRVHTGEKPYSCHVCGKSFSQSGSLRTHIVTHSEERPFPCEICESRFKDKYTLAKHLSTHASGPPCPCSVCGREYSSQRSAAAHARSHARTRTPCGQCGKTFSNVAHLKRHERNVRCGARVVDG